MGKKIILFVLGAGLIASLCFAGSAPDLQEGLWEITSQTNMAGMQTEAVTNTQCLTEDDYMPENSSGGQACEMTNVRQEGDTVYWDIECSGQGQGMNGQGQITYKHDSFEGLIKMFIGSTGQEVTTTMNGRRIGECN